MWALSTASHESPSAIAPGGKRDGPKVLRKVPDLPLTFLGGSSVGVGGDGGVGDSLDRIGRSMTSVTGHMSRCGGVTGGARCSTSCRALGFTGRSVSGECGFSDLGNCHYGSSRRIETRSRFSKELEAVPRVPTCHTHPRTTCFEGLPWSIVVRVLSLEGWEYMLCAVGGPEHQGSVILLVEPPVVLSFHWAPVCLTPTLSGTRFPRVRCRVMLGARSARNHQP